MSVLSKLEETPRGSYLRESLKEDIITTSEFYLVIERQSRRIRDLEERISQLEETLIHAPLPAKPMEQHRFRRPVSISLPPMSFLETRFQRQSSMDPTQEWLENSIQLQMQDVQEKIHTLQIDNAVEQYQKILLSLAESKLSNTQRNKFQFECFLRLSQCFEFRKNYDEAIKQADMALKFDDNVHSKAKAQKVIVLFKMGNAKEAKNILKTFSQGFLAKRQTSFPTYPEWHIAKATQFIFEKKDSHAFRELITALKENPYSLSALDFLEEIIEREKNSATLRKMSDELRALLGKIKSESKPHSERLDLAYERLSQSSIL